MPRIPFTQYTLPDGKKSEVSIDRPPEIYDRAMAIIAAGFHFECEKLRTGQSSLTIGDKDGDYAHQICSNDERDNREAVDALVKTYSVEGLKAVKAAMEADG